MSDATENSSSFNFTEEAAEAAKTVITFHRELIGTALTPELAGSLTEQFFAAYLHEVFGELSSSDDEGDILE